MLEGGVKVVFVTHLFDLADSLHRQQLTNALFLRAERKPGGRRTFRVTLGQPIPTSYGLLQARLRRRRHARGIADR